MYINFFLNKHHINNYNLCGDLVYNKRKEFIKNKNIKLLKIGLFLCFFVILLLIFLIFYYKKTKDQLSNKYNNLINKNKNKVSNICYNYKNNKKIQSFFNGDEFYSYSTYIPINKFNNNTLFHKYYDKKKNKSRSFDIETVISIYLLSSTIRD